MKRSFARVDIGGTPWEKVIGRLAYAPVLTSSFSGWKKWLSSFSFCVSPFEVGPQAY
jgi:hypothetical protein